MRLRPFFAAPLLRACSPNNAEEQIGGGSPFAFLGAASLFAAAFIAVRGHLRAVTEHDYRDTSLALPGVSNAADSRRWEGSWGGQSLGHKPGFAPSYPSDKRP